jgi:hypothetical protein
LIKLDDYLTFGTTPGETVITLPTERTANSTDPVTLKQFRVNFSGTVKIRALYGTENPAYEAFLKILKNGTSQYTETTTNTKVWSSEASISCSRGDLFEIQGATQSTDYQMRLYEVVVTFTPKRAGDIYDIVD